jgi:hypothetical protein
MEFDRIAEFLEAVATEANPGLAVDCLEEWFEQYGIYWSPMGSVTSKQQDTLSRFVSLGGQDLTYFRRMLDEAGFGGIVLTETAYPRSTITYDVDEGYAQYYINLLPFAGQELNISFWLKNVDLISPFIQISVHDGWSDTQLGWTPLTVTDDLTLFTLTTVIPESLVYSFGTIRLTPSDKLSVTKKFIADSGYYGVTGDEYPSAILMENAQEVDVSIAFDYPTTPEIFEFKLTGSVNVQADLNRLATLVQRISPAHCHPDYTDVVIAGNVWGGTVYGLGIYSGR